MHQRILRVSDARTCHGAPDGSTHTRMPFFEAPHPNERRYSPSGKSVEAASSVWVL